MVRSLVLAVAAACLAAPSVCKAQDGPTPGVTEPMPGVQVIDGAAVPALRLEAASLEATLKEDKSFAEIKRLLGGAGIPSVGPAGTTTHMYKLLDTATGKQMVLILFVRGNRIVDYLLT